MWSQLLQKHHLSKKPFDPTGPRERYEINQSRRGNVPTPPPRPKRDESQFVLTSRKAKEKTIRKSFSVFLQLILILQFAIILPILTAAFVFKFGWNEGVPERIPQFNTTTSRCQFEVMGQRFESNTTYNWNGIEELVDGVGNCLVGFLLMVLFATMLTLLYIRANNIFPMILLLVAWTLFALAMERDWFWNYFVYYFGLDGGALWYREVQVQEISTTQTPMSYSTTPSGSIEEIDISSGN